MASGHEMNAERAGQTNEQGMGAATERGRQARRTWVKDGAVMRAEEFAKARGVAPGDLPSLRARGELFAVEIDGETWWPTELLRLPAEECAVSPCLPDTA